MDYRPRDGLHDLHHFGTFRRFRRQPQELLEVSRHPIGTTRPVVHEAAVVLRVGVAGIQLGRAIERRGGSLPVLSLGEYEADLEMRVREAAVQRSCLLR